MQGDAEAQYYLACCYLNGEHAQKDEAAAIPWLQTAAKQNHYKACVQPANCYGQGIGVKENPTAAVEWGKMAAGISNTKEAQDLLILIPKRKKNQPLLFGTFLPL
jgi:TPR repeat protein